MAILDNLTKQSNKLLWENPAPTIGFAAQNITLANADYDYLDIYYLINRKGVSTEHIKCERVLKGYGTVLRLPTYSPSTMYIFDRKIGYVSDTELQIADTTCTISLPETDLNIFILPFKIYGGKF